jgi:hypothetical protein
MPNITAIGAGLYTSLAYIELPVVEGTGSSGVNVGRADVGSNWALEFEDRTDSSPGEGNNVAWSGEEFGRAFGRIREFPNLGIPANIVNVPQYGQPSSSQVVGQSDPPNLDFTFNYVPAQHYFIDDLRASGEARCFRVRLSNGELIKSVGSGGTNDSGGSDHANSVPDVVLPYEVEVSSNADMREFSDFYFFGSVASFEIVPALTDANQLNVSLTIDGQLSGPWSYTTGAAVATPLNYYEAPAA